ncbi:unnamed protein product, partial [Chrysoparadoxa australica]
DTPYWTLVAALTALSLVGFGLFDRTKAGVAVSLLTALLGPAIEIGIVNLLHLYSYTDADFWGVNSWIPVVYALGGPAVGNLSRAFYTEFQSKDSAL